MLALTLAAWGPASAARFQKHKDICADLSAHSGTAAWLRLGSVNTWVPVPIDGKNMTFSEDVTGEWEIFQNVPGFNRLEFCYNPWDGKDSWFEIRVEGDAYLASGAVSLNHRFTICVSPDGDPVAAGDCLTSPVSAFTGGVNQWRNYNTHLTALVVAGTCFSPFLYSVNGSSNVSGANTHLSIRQLECRRTGGVDH